MTLYYNIDRMQHDNMRPLASHTSVWSIDEPFVISGTVNLPKPLYSTLDNFLNLGLREVPVQ